MRVIDALSNFGQYKKFQGEIGLEIETETKEPYEIPKFAFWRVDHDGSLRDFGQEYVLKQPLRFEKEFPQGIDEFVSKTKGIKFIQDSITTSVHVHINMLNENFITLGNFMTAYALLENLLIRFSGEDRKSNLFCLPMCDAEETFRNILRMFDAIQKRNYGGMVFNQDQCKYAALNLSALSSYGSLEIRSFRGTTDPNLIKTWVGILYSILKFSRQNIIPPQIVEGWRDRGPELLTEIFGEYRKDIRVPDENELVEKNFWYAGNIAYNVKDWKALIQERKQFSSKELEVLALKMYAKSFDDLSNAQKNKVINTARQGEVAEPAQDQPVAAPVFAVNWEELVPAGHRAAQAAPVNRIAVDEEAFLNEPFEGEEDL